ncbi:hypothetical protein Plhal304r1_c062g0149281 [Plasmopara halstedii]
MEGYLIRIPNEACIPDTRPAWRQRSDAGESVQSRVLYYIIEAGYIHGYESLPCYQDEPVESFQLTSCHIEINVMRSLNLFEMKAYVVSQRQLHDETSNSNSDSSDDDDRSPQKLPPAMHLSFPRAASNYHVFFLAPSKDLVQKWSVKLLNWNRFVFSSYNALDGEKLQQSRADIVESLRVVRAANRFLRPIRLRSVDFDSDDKENIPLSTHNANEISLPVNTLTNTDTINKSYTLTSTASSHSAFELEKFPESTPWWIVPAGRSRRISSHSLKY